MAIEGNWNLRPESIKQRNDGTHRIFRIVGPERDDLIEQLIVKLMKMNTGMTRGQARKKAEDEIAIREIAGTHNLAA